MANEYATSAELKKTLELAAHAFADDDIALALTAASRGIDEVTERRFWADADANQIRFYSPGNAQLVWIDDLRELTSLASDPGGDGTFENTWTLNQDFLLEPLNAAADGKPWTAIRVHGRGAFRLTGQPRSLRVTGRFGWPAVPAQIKEATMILAAKLLKRAREAPFGVAGLGIDSAAVRVARSDPDVWFLIEPFRRLVI